jgi:GNAT superfamily N-acetyltransferase
LKIQVATLCDLKYVAPIAIQWKNLCNGISMGIDVRFDNFMADVEALIRDNDKDLLLLLEDTGEVVGYMGITTFDNPLGNQKIANEHYWYVSESHRGRGSLLLVSAARKWAKEKGCSHLIMTASTLASDLHDRVCNLYEHLGLKKFETSYICSIKETF